MKGVTIILYSIFKINFVIFRSLSSRSPCLTLTDGNNSWLKALKILMAKSHHMLQEFPLDWLEEGIRGYYDLDLSKKLILLNFLCDEALGTM